MVSRFYSSNEAGPIGHFRSILAVATVADRNGRLPLNPAPSAQAMLARSGVHTPTKTERSARQYEGEFGRGICSITANVSEKVSCRFR